MRDIAFAAVVALFVHCWAVLYRYANGLNREQELEFTGYYFYVEFSSFAVFISIELLLFSLYCITRWRRKRRRYSLSYVDKIGLIVFYIAYLVFNIVHSIIFVYPNTLMSPSPIATYMVAHIMVWVNSYTLSRIQQWIVWIVQTAIGVALVKYTQTPLHFVVANVISAPACVLITSVTGLHTQRCAIASWNEIVSTTKRLVEDRDKMLPRGMLILLQRNDASEWYKLSQRIDSAAVLLCGIKNLAELRESLNIEEFVTVLHHVYSVCDRVVRNTTPDVRKTELSISMYMAIFGLNTVHHATFHAYNAAAQIVAALNNLPVCSLIDNEEIDTKIILSCGVSVGPVLTGVTGTSYPHYSVYGSTVSTAVWNMAHADPGTVRGVDGGGALLNDSGDGMMDVMVYFQETDDPVTVGLSEADSGPVRILMPGPPRKRMIVRDDLCGCDSGSRTFLTHHMPSYSLDNLHHVGNEQSDAKISRRIRTTSQIPQITIPITPSFIKNDRTKLYRSSPELGSKSSRTFYALRLPSLLRPARLAHNLIMIASVAYLIMAIAMNWHGLAFSSACRAVTHIAAPKILERVLGSDKSLMIVTCIVLVSLSANMTELVILAASTDPTIPEFYIGYGCVTQTAFMEVLYVLYRLPRTELNMISIVYSIIDISLMAIYHRSWFLVARFIITLVIGLCTAVLSSSLSDIDYDVYKRNYHRLASLLDVTDLYAKIVPDFVVKLLESSGTKYSGVECGQVNFVQSLSCDRWSVPYVSPLVAPSRRDTPGSGVSLNAAVSSCSRWQQKDHVIVVYTVIDGLDAYCDNIEYLRAVSAIRSLIEQLTSDSGLWMSQVPVVHGDDVIMSVYIAVAGLPETSSYDNPVDKAVNFAENVKNSISSKNLDIGRMFENNVSIPVISARIAVAAGSFSSAIISEYSPVYLMWGNAVTRAADIISACKPNSVLLDLSVTN